MNPFSVSYNGLTIDGDSLYTINKLEGVDGVGIRISEDLLTGLDGGNIWASKYDMRTISIEGTIKGDGVDGYFEAKNSLVRAFGINTNNELSITMWDGTTRTISAYVITAPMISHSIGRNTFNRFQVQLKCPYPFFSDNTVVSETITLEEGGGFPVPMPVPSPVTGGMGDTASINNEGDVPAFASFTINGEVEDATIANLTTGQSFSISGLIGTGESVLVYANQNGFFVTKDGANYMPNFSGTFFPLQVGVNDIRFTALNYSASASVDVVFSSKYLVI